MSVITSNTRLRRPVAIAAMACAVLAAPIANASAVPNPGPLPPPPAGAPMPVSNTESSYIATHAVTKRAAELKVSEAIASLPVPNQYRPANLALAAQFDRALAGALASPGGCVQVIVDPHSRTGNLFDYGFYPVAGRYCS